MGCSVMAKLREPKRKRISAGASYPGSGVCRDAMVVERFHELRKENGNSETFSLVPHHIYNSASDRSRKSLGQRKKNLLRVPKKFPLEESTN